MNNNLTKEEEIGLIHIIEQEEKDKVKKDHLKFIEYCWMKNKEREPFIVGFHTGKICSRIDKAMEDYQNGKSTYLLIAVHHRSGKSDIVSRFLGAHFLGENPSAEIIQVTYKAELAANFSGKGREIMRSENYQALYPDVKLSRETNKKYDWMIADKEGKHTGGKLYATGLHSGLTGNGFSLGITDDYCSGRAEAESLTQRDNAWDAFTNDFMTRMAPVGIVIILATQWHWDDINGRIKEKMKEDPNFPQFELLTFPAKCEDYTGEGKYPGRYLFLERFSEKWYIEQRALLGRYGAAALLDCNPEMRVGGQLSTDGIVYCDITECPALMRLKWVRVWDLAHTEKQRQKNDPDYTSGTLLAFEKRKNDPVPHLWIKNVYRVREGATKRDREIKRIADMDGPYIKQAIESSIDSKDAFEYISTSLKTVSWNKINISGGDKTVRATPLEPIFEAPGHVHVVRADWNDAWIDEIVKFTGNGDGHDDQVDNLSAGYIMMVGNTISMSAKTKRELAERRKKR